MSPTGCSQASGPCRESSETHYYSTTPGRSCDFDANHSFVHQGVPWDRSLPVDNVQGVEVAERAGDFSSVKAGSGLQEDPLPLEVVEELQEEKRSDIISQTRLLHTGSRDRPGVGRGSLRLTSPPLT